MGIAERKAREKEELRGRIISAALTMYIEEGYEKVSIRKIAEVIEYSPATIYLYFQNKDELMFFAQQEAFDQFFEFLAPVLTIEKPMDQLFDLGKRYLEFGLRNPELYHLMFMLQSPMNVEEVQNKGWECGYETFHLLEVVIGNCKKHGYFQATDVHEITMENWAMVHGMISLYLTDRLIMIPEDQRVSLLESTLRNHIEHIRQQKS